MTDPRRWPSNGRVALQSLAGQIAGGADAPRLVPGEAASIALASASLMRQPDSGLDKVLLFGEPVTVIDKTATHAFIQCDLDRYVGYVGTAALGPRSTATHRVTAPASHVYSAPDIKAPTRDGRSFGSLLVGTGQDGSFLETPEGWVPLQHVTPLGAPAALPTDYAQRLIGTPYLWGGNTGWGIDCSGLVQACHLAAGLPCPRDSDMQAAELGEPVPEGAPLQRGDAVFWRGHIGLLLDAATLIHANAHHMAVAVEPLDRAIQRIAAQEFGAVLGFRRVQS